MHYLSALLPLLALASAQEYSIQVPLAAESIGYFPAIGLGTWRLDPSNATEAVSHAIQTGYRMIDGAAIYGNEKVVGKGIADGLNKTGLSRSDLWVTSKLWNDHHAPNQVPKGLDKTLSDLGLDYLDLYLMHWPVASTKHGSKIDYVATWNAMTLLLQTGKVRFIGVSNFAPEQLDTLLNSTSHVPFAHQMELHPYLQQDDWLAYHKARGIYVTAYSPLGGTNPIYDESKHGRPTPLLENKQIKKIAKKRDCTVAQVALRWNMDRGGVNVIPKSQHADRIDENLGARDCKLEEEDYELITKIGKKHTYRYNNPSKDWGVPLYEGLEGV